VILLTVFRDNTLPFGPGLAVGVLTTCLCWHWIGPHVAPLAFHGWLLVLTAVACGGLMLLSSFVIRLLRSLRGE
jgi:hypothetical protein